MDESATTKGMRKLKDAASGEAFGLKKIRNALLGVGIAIVALGLMAYPANAQLWSGIIAPSRATDWSKAGVTGGIPTRTTICATLDSSASAAQINSAIASCPNDQVVQLGAGTFNLSSTINIYRSKVTLRGQGMATILNFTSAGGSNYFWGPTLIAVQDSAFNPSGYNSQPSRGGVIPSTIRNWIGTNGQPSVYTQGATVLDLSSAPNGLAVGSTLTLWQSDPPDTTVPNDGYFVSAKAQVNAHNVAWQGSKQTQRSGQQQRVRVVAIRGRQVTISPGLYRPTGTWSTAFSPNAGWQSGVISGVGLENFLIQRSVTTQFMIGFNVSADCWISGLGVIGGVNGGDIALELVDSRNDTVHNSWFDPFRGGGVYTSTSYGISLFQCSGCLIENNVFNAVESPIVLNSGTTGTVVAYNFENYTTGEGGLQAHEEGSAMNLYEGNEATKFWADNFHGDTALNTFFRNHFYGGRVGLDLWAYHRWYNVVGNVVNATAYKSIYSDANLYDRWSGVAFRLGYSSQHASATGESGQNVYPDPMVPTSTMLWGNYVTAGASTRWLAAEVPSTDPVFPNPVPASQNLPASFYLAAKPGWWPIVKPWPPIGPDVTGGNLPNAGGHAYTIPAQDCFLSTPGRSVSNFNAIECYGSTTTSVPVPLRRPESRR
jgi:hypothetical protein